MPNSRSNNLDIARDAYRKGLNNKAGNDKYLDILIKHEEGTGIFVYAAGAFWPENSFNFKKAFDHLIAKGNPFYITQAGMFWNKDKFDFEKALDALIKKDRVGEHTYAAGIAWPTFNYKKGFDALKKISKKYYEKAFDSWPSLTAKQALDKVGIDLKGVGKTKDKKMVLESILYNSGLIKDE